jgi:ATP-dependent DNA helicase RecG
MTNIQDMRKKLIELMDLPHEKEWVEFKEAKNNFDSDDLGKYFSALSNAANLNGQPVGWLVFGITNRRPRQIVGTNYRSQQPGLEKLKNEIARHTNHQMTFRVIHELIEEDKRVLLFEIPAAPPGIPTTWNGIAWGRIHESLVPLSVDKIEQIRRKAVFEDWSAQICEEANIDHLDPAAIIFARKEYKEKNPGLSKEVDQWDDLTFLNKAKVSIGGKITKSAILLLGKNECEYFLSPGVARITWILKGSNGIEMGYKHFGPPLILAVDQVFEQVRNLTYRFMPESSLFPVETTQYDPWVIRETLHNAIAHQDYLKGGRINLVEEPETLIFTNLGDFLPGDVEEVIRRDAPPEFYRNRFLAEAMVSFNMIDTIGSGIKRMFQKQRERFFPLPDYDLREAGVVKVKIIGKVIDEKYTKLLLTMDNLSLMDVISLDKVQKGKPLPESEYKILKAKRLIEGRRPNLYVSAKVAAATESKEDYIKKRMIEKDHYEKMIKDYLEKFSVASREEIDRLLINKISDALTDEQKKNYIRNLLQEMRRDLIIEPKGKTRWAKWALSKSS